MGAVRMRNAKPAAKESRLYDHASTAISGARSYSTGSVEGSREVRRSQKTTIALPNIRGIPQWAAKAEKTGTPSKNSKKSCSRNCLPRLPTLGGMNHEPLQ
jgi:hypothetical protein